MVLRVGSEWDDWVYVANTFFFWLLLWCASTFEIRSSLVQSIIYSTERRFCSIMQQMSDNGRKITVKQKAIMRWRLKVVLHPCKMMLERFRFHDQPSFFVYFWYKSVSLSYMFMSQNSPLIYLGYIYTWASTVSLINLGYMCMSQHSTVSLINWGDMYMIQHSHSGKSRLQVHEPAQSFW